MLQRDSAFRPTIQRHERRPDAFPGVVVYHTLQLTCRAGSRGAAGIWIEAANEAIWRRIRDLFAAGILDEYSYWEARYLRSPELPRQRARVFPFGASPAGFKQMQREMPVELLRHGGRTWWFFREDLYWDNEGLTAEEVRALILKAE
jgi:hypothetical protein